MAAWVTPVSVLRVPARMELWSWATRSGPLSFARNSTISTPYAETSPMIALRECPVPATQLNPSIFEVSQGHEYRSVAKSFKSSLTPTAPVTTNSSGFSSSSLLQLIHRRDYISANQVRTEMIQHQLPITPDFAFALPALHAVKSSGDPAAKLKEFCGWMSLVPVADKTTKREPKFGSLLQALGNGSHVDVELIMAFVRICVSKGYTVKIPDHMIPIVVRFALPSVSFQFLEDVISSVAKSYTLDLVMKRKIRFWCRIAMVEYLGIGLVKEATQAFRMGLQYGPSLPRVPSSWLMEAIHKGPDYFGLSEETIAAIGLPKQHLPLYSEPSPRPGPVPDVPPAPSPLGLNADPHDPEAPVKLPHPLEIARFLEIFDSQPTLMRMLSAYIQRKPLKYRAQWVLGEMIYYARRKEWRELIGAFDAYFYRAGVPACLDEYKSQGMATASFVHQRLFPSPYHTSLVWTALVKILRGAGPIRRLFRELMEQVDASKTRNYAQVGPSIVSASREMFDAAHFSPFLVTAYKNRKYKRLVSTFSEMLRLGVEPRAQQLSLLAGTLAATDKRDEAIRVLDRMEDVMKEPGGTRACQVPRNLPWAVIHYLPALRRFVQTKDALGASLVARRILGGGYVKGSDRNVDLLLAKANSIHFRRLGRYQTLRPRTSWLR